MRIGNDSYHDGCGRAAVMQSSCRQSPEGFVDSLKGGISPALSILYSDSVVQGILCRQLIDLIPDVVGLVIIIGRRQVYKLTDFCHILFLQAARCDSRRPEADAARQRGVLRVVGNFILVGRDVHGVEEPLHVAPCRVELPEIDQHEMIVRATGDKVKPAV